MPNDIRKPPEYSAEDARGGEIILRRRWQRMVFIAGLVGCIAVILLLRTFSLLGS